MNKTIEQIERRIGRIVGALEAVADDGWIGADAYRRAAAQVERADPIGAAAMRYHADELQAAGASTEIETIAEDLRGDLIDYEDRYSDVADYGPAGIGDYLDRKYGV